MAEKPAALNHIPSHTVRITAADEEPTEVKQIQPMKTTDGSLEMKEVKIWRRFRRYIHSRGSKKVYYKEYGDPRVIDCRNGKVVKGSLEKKYHANPMIHFYIYSPRSPYGIPRWIGQLFSVFGSRSAEEINFKTLKSNNIPSMLVLVSNGMLTEGSISRIEEFVETQIAGDGNYSKFLLLEAEAPEEEGLGSTGTMKIETTPLTNVQHTDQLFQLYDENNADKIRRAFRLPPIFVGKAQDYTRATAEQSRRLADEQVFAPERLEIDHVINYRLLPLLEIKYHRFQSNSPNTTDNKELAQILSFSEKTGGLTPNIARAIMSDIFGIDLGEVDPSKFDGDIPFTITIAEKVKKQDPRLNQEAIVSKITKTLLGINEAEAEGGVLDVDQINDLLDLRRMVTDAINDKYADEFEDLDKEAAL
jgi:PBSX family phage portal protein